MVLVNRDFGGSSRPTGDVKITGIHCTRNLSELHYTLFFFFIRIYFIRISRLKFAKF